MPDRWGRACACVALAAAALLAQTERKLEYRNVPAAVRAAFEKQFAGARVLGAAAETEAGATLFEIECEWRSRHHDITFREDGSLVSVEETIPMSEVPAPVAAALKKEFPKARVTRAEKISGGGTVAYEFQLQGAAKREAKFSADGRLLSSE